MTRYYDTATHVEIFEPSDTTIESTDPRVAEFFKPLPDGHQVRYENDLPIIEPIPAPTAEELEAQKQAEINAEALRYLAETDWYVIRASEGGKAVPKAILTKRKKARLAVKRD